MKMKYLQIHKLFWLIFVILFTLCEIIIIYFIFTPLYVIWNFKFPKNIWDDMHREDVNWFNSHMAGPKETIFNTIKRRYKILF